MNGNVSTAVIVALLIVIGFIAVRKYVKNLRHGCCGGSGEEKVKVADKNAAHYPYSVTLKIEGMRCANCTDRVENALNRLDGIWAKVSLKRAEAVLLRGVRDAGLRLPAPQPDEKSGRAAAGDRRDGARHRRAGRL